MLINFPIGFSLPIPEKIIPGHYSRDCDGPGGHYYRMEDADCPIRQFMVVLEYQEARFEMEPWWLTRYWEAANNMREPTFPESMDFFDPNAPRRSITVPTVMTGNFAVGNPFAPFILANSDYFTTPRKITQSAIHLLFNQFFCDFFCNHNFNVNEFQHWLLPYNH